MLESKIKCYFYVILYNKFHINLPIIFVLSENGIAPHSIQSLASANVCSTKNRWNRSFIKLMINWSKVLLWLSKNSMNENENKKNEIIFCSTLFIDGSSGRIVLAR